MLYIVQNYKDSRSVKKQINLLVWYANSKCYKSRDITTHHYVTIKMIIRLYCGIPIMNSKEEHNSDKRKRELNDVHNIPKCMYYT